MSKLNDVSCISCKARLNNIFCVLENEDNSALSNVKTCSSYKKGQYVFSENSYPQGLFCINQGNVKIVIAGVNGKEQIVKLLKPGDIAGYYGLISNKKFNCSAIALEDSSICFIPKENFFELLKEKPKVNYELLKLFANDLQQSQEKIVSMAQKNVRERLAEALLFFMAYYGLNDKDHSLNHNFSRDEIADFVGTSTVSAIRLLSEFDADKMISIVGKKIIISDVDKLNKTANLDY